MHSKVGNPLVLATIGIWLALEVALVLRDRVRGKGARTNDLGTRRLIAVASAASFALTGIVAGALRHHSTLWLPGAHGDGPLMLGLALMWAGLGLRVWAIAVLGEAFRTTVEVDAGQQLVESGPYRMIRHPSYSGVLLIAVGYGVVSGAWPALAIATIGPFVVLLRRILVEERSLINTMGSVYCAYQQRTKRLVPRLW